MIWIIKCWEGYLTACRIVYKWLNLLHPVLFIAVARDTRHWGCKRTRSWTICSNTAKGCFRDAVLGGDCRANQSDRGIYIYWQTPSQEWKWVQRRSEHDTLSLRWKWIFSFFLLHVISQTGISIVKRLKNTRKNFGLYSTKPAMVYATGARVMAQFISVHS